MIANAYLVAAGVLWTFASVVCAVAMVIGFVVIATRTEAFLRQRRVWRARRLP